LVGEGCEALQEVETAVVVDKICGKQSAPTKHEEVFEEGESVYFVM